MNLDRFRKDNYLILDQNDCFEIESLPELTRFFKGYQKVIFTLLLSYFKLPRWKVLIFKDFGQKEKKVLSTFVDPNRKYFVRTDTFNEYISNVSYIGDGGKVFEKVKEFKKIDKRYVIIMEENVDSKGSTLYDASGRTGMINGEELQEWVGPGFAEYHLARDRFPDKCTVHAVMRYSSDAKYDVTWQADEEKYQKDIDDLFLAMAVRNLGLNQMFVDRKHYRKLVGRDIAGEQATQDEIVEAFEVWKIDFAQREGISCSQVESTLIESAKERMQREEGEQSTLISFIGGGKKRWKPRSLYIKRVHKYLQYFQVAAKKIKIDPNEKLLTYTISQGITSKDIIFWDIHNLNLF